MSSSNCKYTPAMLSKFLNLFRTKYGSTGPIKSSRVERLGETRYILTWSHFLRQNLATLSVTMIFNKTKCRVVGLMMKPVVTQYLVPVFLKVKERFKPWLSDPLPDSSISTTRPLKYSEAKDVLEVTLELLSNSVHIPSSPVLGAKVLEDALAKGSPVFFDTGKSMVYIYLEAYASNYTRAVKYLRTELRYYLAYETLKLLHSGAITVEPLLMERGEPDNVRLREALESLLKLTIGSTPTRVYTYLPI